MEPTRARDTDLEQLARPSLVQRRMWFLHELLDDRSAYNVAIGLRFSGPLDVRLLEQGFAQLVARHEILRTRLELDEGDLVQVIEPPFAPALPVRDLSGRSDAESRAQEHARRSARLPFELDRAPLWRLELLRLAPERHVLLFVVHHVVSDGWSLGILFRELAELYGAALRGERAALPELELQYADFSEWQADWASSEACRQGVEFWRGELAGAPPVLDLPGDRPRPSVFSYRGGVVTRRIARSVFEAASELARREQATPFTVLLACFQTLLFRYTGESDLVVGVTSGSRPHAGLENLFGCFLNALALRVHASGEMSFRELVAEVRRRALAAFDHRDVPFELVVDALAPRRDRSHAPLFQSMFVYENAPVSALTLDGETPEIAFGTEDLRLRVFTVPTDTTKYDLTLYAWPSEQGLLLQCEYAADLFDAKTLERWLEHFELLLRSVCADPGARLAEIPLCSGTLAQALGPRSAPREAGGVHRLFERSVRDEPEAIALRGSGIQDLSRAELNARANRLARELRARGVGLEDRVGICLERSPSLVVAVLAVWKAGAAYVPLDPAYPRERLAYLIEDSRMRLAISRAGLVERMPLDETPVLQIEEGVDFLAHQEPGDLDVAVVPENLAYVLYTSGSTGLPKGVLGLHRTLVNRIGWEPFPAEPGEACALRTSLNFIDSIWEIVGSVSHGMPSVIVGEDVARDPWRLAECLERHGVTRLFLVPTLLKSMLEADLDWSRLRGVRYWLCGGEPLQREVARRFAAALPGAVLLNLYGTTEFWDAAWYDAGRGSVGAHVPIGSPIANVETWVLDAAMNAVPPGVAGELYVSGVGLARGYHARPGLTAERFVPHPYAERPGQRLYRTGDRARLRSDGSIEVLGRSDSQAKIRGHRVELAEVEQVLLRHPEIGEAVVAVREAGGERGLIAWVVGIGGRELAQEALRAHARRFLPDYALPAAMVALDRLPMTPSGKIDRKALPVPALEGPANPSSEPPTTDLERTLLGLWESVLGMSVRSVRANFFELGGDSVQMVRIVARARRRGVQVQLREFYAEPTIAGLARAAERASGGTAGAVQPSAAEQRRAWLAASGRALRLNLDVRVLELAADVSPDDVERALGVELSRVTLRGVDAVHAEIGRWGSIELDPCAALLIEAAGTRWLAVRVVPWQLPDGGWSAFCASLAAQLPAGALRPAQARVLDLRATPAEPRLEPLPRAALEARAAQLRLRVEELLLIAAARAVGSVENGSDFWIEAVPSSGIAEPRPAPLQRRLPDALPESVRAAKSELRARGTVDETGTAPRLLVRVEDVPAAGALAVLERGRAPLDAASLATELCAVRCVDSIDFVLSSDPRASHAEREALAHAFAAELRRLLEHERWPAREVLVPSDFPHAELSEDELDIVLERCASRGRDAAAIADVFPLSSTQLGMVYHRLYEPGSSAYFQQLWFDLDGSPDLRALRAASEQVIAEHDVFRISVEWDGLREPHQLVWTGVDADWQVLDLRSLAESEQALAIDGLLAGSRRDGFSVERPPLHRWLLVRRSETAYTFIFSFHHVILDGWSTALVLSRFFDLYEAYAAGSVPERQAAPSYHDFIRWHRAQDLGAARRFWSERLAGVATPTRVGARGGESTPGARIAVEDWDEVSLALDAAATERMRELGRTLRVTPSTQVYAAWAIVLGRHAGARDVLFGATVSGRSPELSEVERRVGLLINTVPVRVELRDEERVDRWLVALQEALGEQAPFEGTPLPAVQQCSAIAAPRQLFHSIVVYENFPIEERFRRAGVAFGGRVSAAQFFERTSYPVTLAVVPVPGEPLRMRLIHDRSVVDAATARQMLEELAGVLRDFSARPDGLLAALRGPEPAVDEDVAPVEAPRESLLRCIEAHARSAPDRPALEHAGVVTSYAALDARAGSIARVLRQKGVARGSIVGVRIPRSPDAIAAILGILKAGAAYLPLEPGDPFARAAQMLEESEARLLICPSALDADAGAAPCPVLELDALDGGLDPAPAADFEPDAGPGDLAYVIYTSGSSGRPKGVAVERRSLEFYARAAARFYELTPADRVLQFASLCFDASIEEIFPCLLSGATLVLRTDEMIDSPLVFLEAVRSQRLSVVPLPTAYWHEVCFALEQGAAAPGDPLRLLVIGGEAARARAWTHWRENAPGSIRVVNTYGPTETTVVATWCDLSDEPAVEPLPIGRPVPGVRALILDGEGFEVPLGTPGELHLGGPGVARGYLSNASLTAQRFVPDPGGRDGARLYRTGDIVRARPDGSLEYLGRADDQVKIRGIRVEPAEVELLIGEHEGVADCAVIAIGSAANRRLIAFVVAAHEVSSDALRAFARARLPKALVPERIHFAERLPRTTRGKLDRVALAREAEALAPGASADDVVRTPGEELLTGLWCHALGVDHVGLDDSFFDLGGNSLSGARLMFAVEHAFGVRIPLKQLFEAATVAGLSRLLNDRRRALREASERELPREAVLADEVRPVLGAPPGEVREVLLTGATGLVGAFLLADLLSHTDLRIHALVRAADAAEAASRIERVLAQYRLPRKHLERVVPIPGDLGEERLGLDPAAAEALARSVQAIYHSGAMITRATYEALAPANIRGTAEIIRLACTGAPKILHFISTMGVVAAASALTPSNEVDELSPLDNWRALPPGYSQTKWVAERMVNEAARRGLQTVVYRPGLVIGSTLTGAASVVDGPARIMETLLELGALPADEVQSVAVIPVDQLARAIVHLAEQPESVGRVYHLFDPVPAPLAEMSTWLRSAGYPLEEISRQEWIDRVVAQSQRSMLFRALADTLLREEVRDVEPELTWRNEATVRALAASGIRWGGLTENLFRATLRYWVEEGHIPPPRS